MATWLLWSDLRRDDGATQWNNTLEDENAKLKKLLAEAMLGNAMLKDVA